ncbi:hypothetical protein Tco_0370105 [Tanacetum coccineum]
MINSCIDHIVCTSGLPKQSIPDVTARLILCRETRAISLLTVPFLSTTWHFSLGLDQIRDRELTYLLPRLAFPASALYSSDSRVRTWPVLTVFK